MNLMICEMLFMHFMCLVLSASHHQESSLNSSGLSTFFKKVRTGQINKWFLILYYDHHHHADGPLTHKSCIVFLERPHLCCVSQSIGIIDHIRGKNRNKKKASCIQV